MIIVIEYIVFCYNKTSPRFGEVFECLFDFTTKNLSERRDNLNRDDGTEVIHKYKCMKNSKKVKTKATRRWPDCWMFSKLRNAKQAWAVYGSRRATCRTSERSLRESFGVRDTEYGYFWREERLISTTPCIFPGCYSGQFVVSCYLRFVFQRNFSDHLSSHSCRSPYSPLDLPAKKRILIDEFE